MVDRVVNLFLYYRTDIVKPHSLMPIGGSFTATPLSHAVACHDWAFAEWLLEKGADPEASNRRAFCKQDWLCYGRHKGKIHHTDMNLPDLIEKVKKKKEGGV